MCYDIGIKRKGNLGNVVRKNNSGETHSLSPHSKYPCEGVKSEFDAHRDTKQLGDKAAGQDEARIRRNLV